jgi:hypothetical protein
MSSDLFENRIEPSASLIIGLFLTLILQQEFSQDSGILPGIIVVTELAHSVTLSFSVMDRQA